MKPIVQISLDLETLKEALEVAEVAVAAGVDYLEAGTPLILGEGVHAIRALRERYPDKGIVADIKCMDGGYPETVMMAEAGATHVVVMSVALEAVARAVKIPVQAVGGLSIEQITQAPKLGAPLVVVGAPLVIDDGGFRGAASLEQLGEILRRVVKEVKGL